ncbi:hypothetical protein D6V22_14715 [Vibrio cholerae]|uniref:Uncharacterized protein n=1 Tax=Vibrio cholerae TaxID=666 RepID=A0A7Z7YDV8_VIBCL|nr:hypothetical protein [Vibrio cholerae]EGR0260771.1 hypothetical protein [Vibrio cholerae]EGR0287130.1 hypothetical protein [Vibrio cholerae]EGR0524860.1 hypothetical protein [Vibrio cholerae]EGR0600728.1 hypothetical protein [Vibrio cholerae]
MARDGMGDVWSQKLSHKLRDKLNRHRVQLTDCKQRSVLFESCFAILRGEWLRNGAENSQRQR